MVIIKKRKKRAEGAVHTRAAPEAWAPGQGGQGGARAGPNSDTRQLITMAQKKDEWNIIVNALKLSLE